MEEFFDGPTQATSTVSAQPASQLQAMDDDSQSIILHHLDSFSRVQSSVNQQQAYDYSDVFQASDIMEAAPSNQPSVSSAAGLYVSPEQQLRKDRLKQLEEDRVKQVREREENERTLKQAKQQKAKEYLAEFKIQQTKGLENRKQQNRATQAVLLEARAKDNEYKNSWEKVVGNISLKDGESSGSKDVTKMRQAILNKRSDLNK